MEKGKDFLSQVHPESNLTEKFRELSNVLSAMKCGEHGNDKDFKAGEMYIMDMDTQMLRINVIPSRCCCTNFENEIRDTYTKILAA
jgi:hypothetical protein